VSTTSRKLAAILSADVAGYSRLMSEDEQATLATLTEYRAVMAALIAKFRGRVVDAPGDALLAEFPSAVDAVQCALEIQQDLAQRNSQLPESRRMLFRIGVNLGDVIEQDGALYGDGVNIAARLEALAKPGGVCVSGTVFDQVDGKVTVPFRFAGEQTVKNIAKPVRAYHAASVQRKVSKSAGKRRHVAIALASVLLGILVWIAAWHAGIPGLRRDPALQMPSGTVVAVLPFTNMGSDPEQGYFSDGLTEDIITDLARFRDLHVLARNTTFQYKGQAVNVPEVGRKLGARYVVEGSVRRSGDQLRITAQLIDTSNGAHVWAEKYDRRVEDVFAIQDEITGKIVASIAGSNLGVLYRAVMEAGKAKRPQDLEAYELVLRGSIFDYDWSKENYVAAKADLERAIQLAPDYARARQQYAYTLLMGWVAGFEDSPAPSAEILQNAIQAVQLDPSDHRAHRTAAAGYFFAKQLSQFEKYAERAIEMAPHDGQMLAELGALLTFSGRWDRGVALVSKAHALNPIAARGWYESAVHYDYFRKGRFQEALDVVLTHPEQGILHTEWKYVAAYAELGDITKAREHFDKCLQLDPKWSADEMMRQLRLWNFPDEFVERYLESYAKAGYYRTGDPRAGKAEAAGR
jgi:adenylate cyclase